MCFFANPEPVVLAFCEGVNLDLPGLAEVHEKERHEKENTGYAQPGIFICLVCFRHQSPHLILNQLHLPVQRIT